MLLLISATAVGALPSTNNTQKWVFLPNIGLEGQAYMMGNDAYKIEIECGNGGGPSIVISSSELSRHIAKVIPERTTLDMVIDGHVYSETFVCVATGAACGSYGFPSAEVITAIRQGNHLALLHEGSAITEFSLVGSNAAVSRLTACFQ
jgi:hypothetical protein